MTTALHPRKQAPDSYSRLLNLPRELRDQILRYLVIEPEPINLRRPEAIFSKSLNILLACKQLRDEANPLLHHGNVLEIDVDSHGPICSLHFSKYHSVSEYRAEEAVGDVSSVSLNRFCRFQFRLLDTRTPHSLRRAIRRIEHGLNNKHITVVLPSPDLIRVASQASAMLSRTYPQIDSPLLAFAFLRCSSFQVLNSDSTPTGQSFATLVGLVTSRRPALDMATKYDDLLRSARAINRLASPNEDSLHDIGRLRSRMSHYLRVSCQSASAWDQDAFVTASAGFERCYHQILDLEWQM